MLPRAAERGRASRPIRASFRPARAPLSARRLAVPVPLILLLALAPLVSAQTAEDLLAQGDRALEARSYHDAIRLYEAARERPGGTAAARERLSLAYSSLGAEFTGAGELRRAREAFEKSLQEGERASTRLGLGYLDFLERKDSAAREHIEKAIALEGSAAALHKILALLDYRAGDTALALERIERSGELDPKDAESRELAARWRKEAEIRPRLVESASRHFILRSEKAVPRETAAEVLVLLEEIFASIGQSLGHWPRSRVPILLLSERSFREVTGTTHWVGGLYDGQIKAPIRDDESLPRAGRPILQRTLRHEFTHVVVKEICPSCPNWLNEGIAQYFESPDPRGGSGGVDLRGSERRAKVKLELLRLKPHWIPFEKLPIQLSGLPEEGKSEGAAQMSYLESLGFVLYLVEKHRSFRLQLLLSSFAAEGSLQKAFETTYGSSLGDLEREWWKSLESP